MARNNDLYGDTPQPITAWQNEDYPYQWTQTECIGNVLPEQLDHVKVVMSDAVNSLPL